MLDYKEGYDGSFYKCDTVGVIPKDVRNTQYREMLEGIELGDAQIIPYVMSFGSYQKTAKNEIDKKTDELIEAGYTHNTHEFKVNLEKEISALALQTARMGGTPMAGKQFRGKERSYTFIDDADWDAFFATGFGRLETVLNEGSDLKDSIDDAVDEAAVDAIVDTRV